MVISVLHGGQQAGTAHASAGDLLELPAQDGPGQTLCWELSLPGARGWEELGGMALDKSQIWAGKSSGTVPVEETSFKCQRSFLGMLGVYGCR